MREPARWALAALTVVFIALGLVQAARDFPTVDEGPDLAASLVTVERRDLRMNPEHGALFHAASGVLPVLLADPIVPETEAYRTGDWFDHTDDLLEANDEAGRLDEVLLWFRVVPLLMGAGVAWVLHALGRRIGGAVGGLLAGGLWLTTPYVLGLSHLGSLDVAYALAATALALAVVRCREAPSPGRVLVVALVLGAALATRHSAVVLAPVALVLVATAAPDRRTALRYGAVLVVVPVLTVWGVHRSIDPVPAGGPVAERFDGMIAAGRAQGPLEEVVLAVPMPVEWQAGFAYLALTSGDRPAYLLGDTVVGSRPLFFPTSAAVKVPVTALVALIAGAALLIRRRQGATVALTAGAFVATTLAFLLLQPLNLGLRLAVPTVALAMVAVAGLAPLGRSGAGRVALGVLTAGQLAATAAAHPTSLAWSPPPFSDGYRFVSDSSIDFGQALHRLRDEHEDDPFVAVSVVTPRGLGPPSGTVPVEGADAEDLVGRVAVGATPLTVTSAGELSWLRAYCPVEVLDAAILVYEFDAPPDTTGADGMPEPPCDGAVSSRR